LPKLKDRLPVWKLANDDPRKKQLMKFIETYQETIQNTTKAFGVNIFDMNNGVYMGYKQESWKYIFLLLWSYDLGKVSKEALFPELKAIFRKDYEISYAEIANNPKTKGLLAFVGKKNTDLSKEENLNGLVSDLLRFKFYHKIRST